MSDAANDFVTLVLDLFKGRRGVEIGGPSPDFGRELPVYDVVASLDGVNFGGLTVWEGGIESGAQYDFGGAKPGVQIIAEATDLAGVPSASYEFVLSSNCLEHVANPIKAILEWRRVLRPGGLLLLLLPIKEMNFDHRRPVTTFDHLLRDYLSNVGEDDLTHLDEILQLHDLARDPAAGKLENFRKRSLKNVENRTLHHHVFDAGLAQKMLSFANFEVMYSAQGPVNYCLVATSRP